MQIYIGDELAETSHLSAEEYGSHMRLRLHQWLHGELPTEDERLRRICMVDREQWPSIRDALAPLFDWQWHHVKTADLRRQSEELRQTKVENGKKGGRPRKQAENLNETETKPIGKANGKADGKLNETPSPSASPTPSSPSSASRLASAPENWAPEKRGEEDTVEVNAALKRYPVPVSLADGKRFLKGLGVPESQMTRSLNMLMEGQLCPFDVEEWIDVRAMGAA